MSFDLDKFSKLNLKRCESKDGFNHALESWEYEQWTNAIAGEVGEACNIAKKHLRLRQQIRGNKQLDQDKNLLEIKLAKELADVVIYCDLAMQRLGMNLGDVIRDVFNAKSKEIGCDILIPDEDSKL